MKLRYIYFLSILLSFISVSIEEVLGSNNKNTKRGRSIFRRKIRKRHNYEMNDEKEPLSQIDVSNFIQNPDDNTVDELYSDLFEERKQAIQDLNGDEGQMNPLQLEKIAQDYQNFDVPEKNIYKERYIVPQNVNVNEFSDNSYLKTNKHGIGEFQGDMSPPSFGPTKHSAKKCALNNMRIPFFSRSKTETTKAKKNKKRKFSFRNSKKQNPSVTKLAESHLNSGVKIPTKEPQDFKIKKRSYFERLCPACKQKILNANLFEDKSRGDIIHNSRQYYQHRNEEQGNIFNRHNAEYTNHYNFETDNNIKSTNSHRWKRESERREILKKY